MIIEEKPLINNQGDGGNCSHFLETSILKQKKTFSSLSAEAYPLKLHSLKNMDKKISLLYLFLNDLQFRIMPVTTSLGLHMLGKGVCEIRTSHFLKALKIQVRQISSSNIHL